MNVKIILESKEGICINLDKINRIAMSDDMIILQYKFRDKEYVEELKKDNIRYLKIIQERKNRK